MISNEVEDEWLQFLHNGNTNNCDLERPDVMCKAPKQSSINQNQNQKNQNNLKKNDKNDINQCETVIDDNDETDIFPKCSDIYISTKTKISYLDRAIDLDYLFWQIPIIEYHEQTEGIIKKQMKFQCFNRDSLQTIIDKTQKYYYYKSDIINSIDNPDGKIKFKDTRKVNIGICRKDILNTRCKVKSAFYNCFVLVFRIDIVSKRKSYVTAYDAVNLDDANDVEFREIHVKIFNTGKLEIPGVKDDWLLDVVLDKLIVAISKIERYSDIKCEKDKTETVLINSNFNCGYYIDRERMYELLRNKYNINCSYDPCSYPGIQCRFYYNTCDTDYIQTGCQPSSQNNADDSWIKISFMIFRTGSVLIVGKCSETILNNIYVFIREILEREYTNIGIDDFGELKERQERVKSRKYKKRIIYIDSC